MMGKRPQYIALSYIFSHTRWFMGLFVMALLIPCHHVSAQQENSTNLTRVDSGAYYIDPSNNGKVKKDTVTQSLAAMDNTSTDSANAAKAKKIPLHSARKAAYLSAVLPGLGQAYNKHYWKIPVIYAGFGGLTYAMIYTTTNFKGYRAAYRLQVATIPNPNASYNGVADAATLKAYRDYFKKYVDISAIGIGVWYLLNVIDATVDAHLTGWNMKDDLSVSWHPVLLTSPNYNAAAGGVSIALHF